MKRIFLLIALNVGVMLGMGVYEDEDPGFMISLYDQDELKETAFYGLSPEATLATFLLAKTEKNLSKNWAEVEPMLVPMINQTWKPCRQNNPQATCIEAPIIYAAKKGLYTFISSVLANKELIPKERFLDEALHGAVVNGHVQIISALLKAGADPNRFYLQNKFLRLTVIEIAVATSLELLYGKCAAQRALFEIAVKQRKDTLKDGYEGWSKVMKKHPQIRLLYQRMLLFNSDDLSLKQWGILHCVNNIALPIANLPDELKNPIQQGRIISKTDYLFNLDH